MIRIEQLTKRFGAAEPLHEISLEVRPGEVFTLIGPSGSGKTTLIRLIDLLDNPTTGRIIFDGRDTAGTEQERLSIRRRMGMVFQKPAVLNTTVAQNVAFGLKFRGIGHQEIDRKVQAVLELVGLPDFANRRAVTLSGGEMQRVAIARAMVTEPEVLLLDEPTANLDPVSSELIEDLIIRINREMDTTIILSTHDMIQGQRLADRIGVIMNGRLVQVGSATDIFYKPMGRDIARFVGIDTILRGTVTANDAGHATIAIGSTIFEALTPLQPRTRVALYFRPEEVTLTPAGRGSLKTSVRNQLNGRIVKMVPFGPFIRVTVDNGTPLTALITRRSCTELGFAVGTEVVAGVKATAIHVLVDNEEKTFNKFIK
jgi:tungstate transport system ATP-binding protein